MVYLKTIIIHLKDIAKDFFHFPVSLVEKQERENLSFQTSKVEI